jgi:hypothetical protein
MKKLLAAMLVGFVYLFMPITAMASVGVGVGTGKIEIKEQLKAGSVYTLPPITVFNTGTETAAYTMSLALNETQDQLKPNAKWFSFSPAQLAWIPASPKLWYRLFIRRLRLRRAIISVIWKHIPIRP